MRILRRLFYGLSLCIFLVCVAILVFTSKPEWSQKLSALLYGDDDAKQEEVTPAPAPGTDMEILPSHPQNTPLVYGTPLPESSDAPTGNGTTEKYQPKTIDIKTVIPQKTPMGSYQVPMTDKVTVPEAVKGLNGYAEMAGELAEATKEEAEKLTAELDLGDEGSLLVFDQRFYPYYHMLDADEKDLYRQIFANAYALKERFAPCVEIYSTNIGRVVEAVYNDNPVLFWVENSYGCKYDSQGKVLEISLQYNAAAKKVEQSRQKFEEKAEEILCVARTLTGDYAKEKYVHDKLAGMVTYEADAPMNQSAYSALVEGKTVCAGYARAFQYLMQQLEIPCFYCRGYSGENHAWNIVELYGDYYNVDLTWDDAKPGNYDYFNKTDEELKSTHIRKGSSIKLPACAGGLYSGLETNHGETKEDNEANIINGKYSAGLQLYYDKLCDRIEKLGNGSASYSDILDLSVWKELEEAYSNGNNSFREDYLIRALYNADAQYCIISLSAESITENAYEVSCTIEVR